MPFAPIFGGGVIYPSDATFLNLALTANVTLAWPIEQQIGGDVVADIIEVTPSGGGFSVSIPDARQVSTGYTALFYNAGASTFSVKDQGGNTLMTVASGEAWEMYLRDNSTANGSWRVFQYGAGVSNANAGALAGAGLTAITTTLNQSMSVEAHSIDYNVVDADRALLHVWTGGVGAIGLEDPGNLGDDWFFGFRNNGSGTVVLTPAAGQIDGSSSLSLGPDESAFIVTDGVDYFTVGLGQFVNSVFDFISIAVGGTGDFTLSGVQLNRVSYEFTGILTGNRNIIVPSTIQQYWVDNQTTGAFSLTVKTAAGTGVVVPQGGRLILYCDGVDVVQAVTTNFLQLLSGSAAAPPLAFITSPTTGLYLSSADTIGFSAAGVSRGTIGTGTWSISAAPASGVNASLRVACNTTNMKAIRIDANNTGFDTLNPTVWFTTIGAGSGVNISLGGNEADPGTEDTQIAVNGSRAFSITNFWGAGMSFVLGSDTVLALAGSGSKVTLGGTAAANNIRFNNTTSATVGAAGGAAALPATPLGYFTFSANGTNVKVPYYNV